MNGMQNADVLSIVQQLLFCLKENYWIFRVFQLKFYSCTQCGKVCFWFSIDGFLTFFPKS